MLIRLCGIVILTILAFDPALRAQGGPPFITDDPGTPGNHHWEINMGWIADHNPGNAYYQVPDFDINYGWGNRIQLKYELPIAAATDPNNTTRAGLGESLLGVKRRPYEYHRAGEPESDENMLFSLGTYPQASINNPTSAVRRGIVENGPQYYLPVDREASIPGALPLGLFPRVTYEETTLTLEVGDHLALYTDGLLEARSASGELYSFDRLKALFATRPTAKEATQAAVAFGQDDDITVLILTRLGIGEEPTVQYTATALSPA
jgi:hypothetical protein